MAEQEWDGPSDPSAGRVEPGEHYAQRQAEVTDTTVVVRALCLDERTGSHGSRVRESADLITELSEGDVVVTRAVEQEHILMDTRRDIACMEVENACEIFGRRRDAKHGHALLTPQSITGLRLRAISLAR